MNRPADDGRDRTRADGRRVEQRKGVPARSLGDEFGHRAVENRRRAVERDAEQRAGRPARRRAAEGRRRRSRRRSSTSADDHGGDRPDARAEPRADELAQRAADEHQRQREAGRSRASRLWPSSRNGRNVRNAMRVGAVEDADDDEHAERRHARRGRRCGASSVVGSAAARNGASGGIAAARGRPRRPARCRKIARADDPPVEHRQQQCGRRRDDRLSDIAGEIVDAERHSALRVRVVDAAISSEAIGCCTLAPKPISASAAKTADAGRGRGLRRDSPPPRPACRLTSTARARRSAQPDVRRASARVAIVPVAVARKQADRAVAQPELRLEDRQEHEDAVDQPIVQRMRDAGRRERPPRRAGVTCDRPVIFLLCGRRKRRASAPARRVSKAAANVSMPLRDGVVERHAVPRADQRLLQPDRARAAGDERVEDAVDLSIEIGRGNAPLDQAPSSRRSRASMVSPSSSSSRVRPQPISVGRIGGLDDGRDAEPHLLHAEQRRVGRDPHVAGGREFEARAERIAVDARDDGKRATCGRRRNSDARA